MLILHNDNLTKITIFEVFLTVFTTWKDKKGLSLSLEMFPTKN